MTSSDGDRAQANPSGQAQVKEFQVTAERFQFTPSTIEVNQGDTVRLILRSVDVAHGFMIDRHDVGALIPAGGVDPSATPRPVRPVVTTCKQAVVESADSWHARQDSNLGPSA